MNSATKRVLLLASQTEVLTHTHTPAHTHRHTHTHTHTHTQRHTHTHTHQVPRDSKPSTNPFHALEDSEVAVNVKFFLGSSTPKSG